MNWMFAQMNMTTVTIPATRMQGKHKTMIATATGNGNTTIEIVHG